MWCVCVKQFDFSSSGGSGGGGRDIQQQDKDVLTVDEIHNISWPNIVSAAP